MIKSIIYKLNDFLNSLGVITAIAMTHLLLYQLTIGIFKEYSTLLASPLTSKIHFQKYILVPDGITKGIIDTKNINFLPFFNFIICNEKNKAKIRHKGTAIAIKKL
ncbi:hypothetical protein RBU61_06875 [Tissierella sp. MB52-C2]|uniref:hypothetical protein n=1 Tax=Tissierella sp. MB52-C2 TaxID=3070999 RepID=UPI00280B68BD|nr:hypothetical protein [Tissierella sp. MB52-C2]WMM26389.1 hypothetical protein RBU61_06875 [Tissierella sp. MB52-C2]